MAVSVMRQVAVAARSLLLDSMRYARAPRQYDARNSGFALKKKFARIYLEGATRPVARRRIARIEAK
jgi:hypothetical protein